VRSAAKMLWIVLAHISRNFSYLFRWFLCHALEGNAWHYNDSENRKTLFSQRFRYAAKTASRRAWIAAPLGFLMFLRLIVWSALLQEVHGPVGRIGPTTTG
jgi:hypothetical protein